LVPATGQNKNEILRLAASWERRSEHPLAAAIVAVTEKKGIQLANASDFPSITGKGVVGAVDGKEMALSNRRLLEELAVGARDWRRARKG
jgi:Cu+-exporting ATPase